MKSLGPIVIGKQLGQEPSVHGRGVAVEIGVKAMAARGRSEPNAREAGTRSHFAIVNGSYNTSNHVGEEDQGQPSSSKDRTAILR